MLGAKKFKVGNYVDGEFLVIGSSVKQAKSGKSYIDFDVRALDGTIFEGCKRWDHKDCPEGVILLKGSIDEFNGKLQIKADHWEKGEKEANDFQAKCPWNLNVEEISGSFNECLEGISSVDIRKFTELVIDHWSNYSFPCGEKRNLRDAFFDHAGAQRNHHCYRHGLLEHTTEVMEHAISIASTHGIGNHEIDLLIAGCALHDIGKLEEFQLVNAVYQFTDIGKAYGWTSNSHLYIGSQMVNTYVALNPNSISMGDLMVIQNIILSHHGDFGDVKPTYIASMITHMADNVSAQVNRMKMNLLNSTNGEVNRDSTQKSYLAVKDPINLTVVK